MALPVKMTEAGEQVMVVADVALAIVNVLVSLLGRCVASPANDAVALTVPALVLGV
jgi:hypothetical protein